MEDKNKKGRKKIQQEEVVKRIKKGEEILRVFREEMAGKSNINL